MFLPITTNNNTAFESNINIDLASTGFTFEPSTVFLPIGASEKTFRIGADSSLVPVVYFYQGTKSEETNTYYAITLNMNIEVHLLQPRSPTHPYPSRCLPPSTCPSADALPPS